MVGLLMRILLKINHVLVFSMLNPMSTWITLSTINKHIPENLVKLLCGVFQKLRLFQMAFNM